MKIKIADSIFSPWGNTFHCGGDNLQVKPESFEWEFVDPDQARFVTESHIRMAKGRGQVAVLLEPFFLHPENYLAAMEKPFEYVLTHNIYFSRNRRHWLWYPAGGSFIRFEDWGVRHKRKNVSLPMSPKQQMSGHQLRHQILKLFADQIDDSFGLVQNYRKFDALADYRYAIIVENESTRSFFTEKIIDCFSVGTVPIYWGDPDIGNTFDRNGILTFDTVQDLKRILQCIGPSDYNYREVAIHTNFTRAREYAITEDQIFKRYPFLFGEA